MGSHSCTSPAFACKSAVLAVAIASPFKALATTLLLELKDWSDRRTKTFGGMLVVPILIAPSIPLPVGKSGSIGEFTPEGVGVILENLNEVSFRITIEILKGLAALPAIILG